MKLSRGTLNYGGMKAGLFELTERDLEFVVQAAAPQAGQRQRLKELIREDEDFRRELVGHDNVFRALMSGEEMFLRVSPRLFFEALLRRARKQMAQTAHTVERTGRYEVAVFDAGEVDELLAEPATLLYLADMLASFTRVQSFTLTARIGPGLYEKIRFNDLNLDSLARFCRLVEPSQRFAFYKRMADLCLFISGIFPEYTRIEYRYPFTGEVRVKFLGTGRRDLAGYEQEGRKYYGLAGEHPAAETLGLRAVLDRLKEQFALAQKPLRFLAERYLAGLKRKLFAAA
jgi:hypothetical protein